MKSLLCALSLLLAALCTNAQTTGGDVTLYLNNGNVLSGTLLSSDNGMVSVKTNDGTVLVYKLSEVRKIDDKAPQIPARANYSTDEGTYVNYYANNTGFYFAAESNTAISVHPGKPSIGFEEIDVIGGYRLGYYLRAGIGLGGRYYWNNHHGRYKSSVWAMPLFLDFRGEFMPRAYRTVTPYWNLQTGVVFADGYMIRPTIGLRIGEMRSAFLLGISYTGQSLKGNKILADGSCVKNRHFESFIALKLGYEF